MNDEGVRLIETGRYAEAVEKLEKTIDLEPGAATLAPTDEEIQTFLASLYLRINDREAAAAQYSALKYTNPQIAEKIYRNFSRGKVLTIKH